MNIKGLELLINPEFPFMRNTFLFRQLSDIPETEKKAYLSRISKDSLILPPISAVDFACLDDGYFFYHDLCIIKKQ